MCIKAIVVEAEAYLTELSRYVHLNPVRIGAVRQVTAEEKLRILKRAHWSSLAGYVNTQNRSSVVEYGLVLASFGGDTPQGRRAYARYIEEGARGQVMSPWEHLRGQVLLGSEAFVERLRPQAQAGRAAEREQPARRALAQAWDLDAAVEALADELGREVAKLCRRGGGLERALVMECLYRYRREPANDWPEDGRGGL